MQFRIVIVRSLTNTNATNGEKSRRAFLWYMICNTITSLLHQQAYVKTTTSRIICKMWYNRHWTHSYVASVLLPHCLQLASQSPVVWSCHRQQHLAPQAAWCWAIAHLRKLAVRHSAYNACKLPIIPLVWGMFAPFNTSASGYLSTLTAKTTDWL